MEFISCNNRLGNEVVSNTLKFWSQNSFQHIDVLLNSYKGTGAILHVHFQKEFTRLFDEFQDIFKSLEWMSNTQNLKRKLNSFLNSNKQFITALERLKFEGFNGYPQLYQTVNHFIYEQEYVNQIFRKLSGNNRMLRENSSVVFNTIFNRKLYDKGVLYCIYSNVYFWSIIGAEHTSIIATASPEEDALPQQTKNLLMEFRNNFNKINYMLSTIYPKLTRKNLYNVYSKFNTLNDRFLILLKNFQTRNSDIFPESIKTKLPPLFFDVLQHLIDEHKYIKSLDKSFTKYLKEFK